MRYGQLKHIALAQKINQFHYPPIYFVLDEGISNFRAFIIIHKFYKSIVSIKKKAFFKKKSKPITSNNAQHPSATVYVLCFKFQKSSEILSEVKVHF